MIPLLVLVPLAVSGGGLLGLVHERYREKNQTKPISSKSTQDASPSSAKKKSATGAKKKGAIVEQEAQAMASGDLAQIKHAEHSAYAALGVSAAGLFYPPLGLVSLPIIGYSAFNWLRARYPFEQPWLKSPPTIFAALAAIGSLATGYWVLAPLILSVDLAARKKLSKWTEGYQVIDKPSNDTEKWFAVLTPSYFIKRRKNLIRLALQGEPRWGKFPALLARVSLGVFFAISGWFKLFTASHWTGLVGAMIATGLPYPKFLSYFLASVEFYGGSLLAVGFMSTFWSIALAFAMLVALITIEIPEVIPPGLGPFAWMDWFLYLPQVLYIIIFLWLIVIGPGPYSIDAVIARKLGVDEDSDKDSVKDSVKSSVKNAKDSVKASAKSVKDSVKNAGKGSGFGSAAPVGSG